MAFGEFSRRDPPMAQINMIPLIDVMLVLLVIFIITAPVFTHAVRINMPTASSQPNLEQRETVTLSIDAESQLYWNDVPVTEAELPARLRRAVEQGPGISLHLRADQATRYEVLARLLATARNAGVTAIAFVTRPAPGDQGG